MSERENRHGLLGAININDVMNDELLLQILERVGPDGLDLPLWGLTCKRWLQLEGQLRTSVKLLRVESLPRCLRRFPRISSLDLASCNRALDSSLVAISQCLPSLVKLNLSSNRGITRVGLNFLAEGCPSLHTLILARCTGVCDQCVSIISQFGQLKVLDLSFCQSITDKKLGDLASGCTLLEDLKLRMCQLLTDDGIKVLCTKLSKLRCLDLSYLEVTNQGLEAVAGLGELKQLVLACCLKVENGGIAALGLGATCLEELDISGCLGVDSEAITSLAGTSLKKLIIRRPGMHDVDISSFPTFKNLSILGLNECVVTEDGLVAIGAGCPLLKDLRLWKCSGVTDGGVCSIVASCPLIQRLDLSCSGNITDQALEAVARNCSHLIELGLEACHGISDPGLEHIASCTALEHLDLSDCQITDVGLSSFSSCHYPLRTLKLGVCPRVTDAGVRSIGCACVNLVSLDLYHLDGVCDAGITTIATTSTRLAHVILSYCSAITDDALVALSNCPHLFNLELRSCSRITCTGLAAIARGCPRLEELDIKRCTGVADQGIVLVVNGCPRLRQINLSYCQISDVALSALTQLPYLSNVKLVYCPNITVACLVRVLNLCQHLKKLKLLAAYQKGIPAQIIKDLDHRFCKVRWMDKPKPISSTNAQARYAS